MLSLLSTTPGIPCENFLEEINGEINGDQAKYMVNLW